MKRSVLHLNLALPFLFWARGGAMRGAREEEGPEMREEQGRGTGRGNKDQGKGGGPGEEGMSL